MWMRSRDSFVAWFENCWGSNRKTCIRAQTEIWFIARRDWRSWGKLNCPSFKVGFWIGRKPIASWQKLGRLKSVKIRKEFFRNFRGGCPKRNICSLDRSEGKTCIYGPYEYCGKYRSIVKLKKQSLPLFKGDILMVKCPKCKTENTKPDWKI